MSFMNTYVELAINLWHFYFNFIALFAAVCSCKYLCTLLCVVFIVESKGC